MLFILSGRRLITIGYDIGPKIGIEGEAAFRQSINSLNTSFKTLGTEMTAVTSAFDKNDKSSKALAAQNGVLNKQIDTQKDKLVQLNSGLAQSTEKYGAADKVTQGWQQAVNKATAELNKMERELESNNKSIDAQNNNWIKLGKSLDTIGNKMKTVGSGISNTGKSMTMGLTVPILGAVAGLGAMVMKSSETADELQKLSDITGLSAERLQELKYAGSALGVDLETITGAQAKLTKAMVAAEKGTGAQAEAFKKLKVDAFDPTTGAIRDSKTVMEELFTALNGVTNETERDSLAMQLFGKSGMALNPIIKAGGKELAKLTDEARKSGAVMSNEAVAGLDKFGDSIDAMKLSISGAVGAAASELMPTFEKLTPIIQDQIVPAIGRFAQMIADLIIKFTTLDPGTQKLILGIGAFLLVIGPVVTVIGAIVTAVGMMATVIGAITLPIVIAIAAIGALIAVGVLLYKNWDTISAFLSAKWGEITTQFSKDMNNIGTISGGKWAEIKTQFGKDLDNIKTIVSNAINAITGFFANLHLPEIKIPHINLPHFNISGSFSLVPPSIPSVGVSWYNKGGIFDRPTVIGVGEKRPEFVGALDDLKDIFRTVISEKKGVSNTSSQSITLQLVLQNGKAIAEFIVDDLDNLMGNKNKITGRMVGV